MPGLIGIISQLPAVRLEEKVRQMLETIRHEPFYSSGSYADAPMFTYVGWTCHKRGFTDCLPIFNENRDIVLFLAGEVFGDIDEIAGLKEKGHEFSDGDASYLVHLYEEMGEDYFEKLNGFFSGVLIDQRHGKSLLFNDRFAMSRIFTHHNEDGFFFSSEAKALVKVLPETREFDPEGVAEFLTCGCTFGNHTLFKDIEVLPGGSLLEFENAKLRRKNRYFSPESWKEQAQVDKNEFISEFTEIFPRVTKKFLSSPEPIAISLTGGLDSRMIISCVGDSPGRFPCHTFGSMYRDTSDVKVSRKVAAACGQEQHTLVLGMEFLRDFPTYLEKAVYIADGYIGLDGAAELFLNKEARHIAPVRLTGNYGGEVLRGVRAFKSSLPKNGYIHREFFGHLEEAQAKFQQLVTQTDPVSFAAFVQAPSQGFGRRAVEQSQLIIRTPFLDHDLMGLVYRYPVTRFIGREVAAELIARHKPELLLIPTDRGWVQDGTSLGKIPYRLYQNALFKAEYWTNHGMPDWVVRLNHVLPWFDMDNFFLGRHKFHHFRPWLRNHLGPYVRDLLINDTDMRLDGYFDRKKVATLVEEHQEGVRNWTEEIDKLVTLSVAWKYLLGDV